jgi:hypothetical protein
LRDLKLILANVLPPALRIKFFGQVATGMKAPHDKTRVSFLDINDAVRVPVDLPRAVLTAFGDRGPGIGKHLQALIGCGQYLAADSFR